MNISSEEYWVPDLSVVVEGEECIVGIKNTDDFYQFPLVAADIINLIIDKKSTSDIENIINKERQEGEKVDVGDFLELLLELELISKKKDSEKLEKAIENKHKDRNSPFSFGLLRTASFMLFSPLSALVFAFIFCLSIYIAAHYTPKSFFQLSEVQMRGNLTLNMAAFLFLTILFSLIHEFSHAAAAAKYRIKTTLSVNSRLWFVVFETDLSGIMSLSRRERYLPIMAGMIMDVLGICLLLLVYTYFHSQGVPSTSLYFIKILNVSLILSLLWQFNFFLRTDVYFLICNHINDHDLDHKSRNLLSRIIFSLTFGVFGKKEFEKSSNHNQVVGFTVAWVVGRIGMFAFLLTVILPLLASYITGAFSIIFHPDSALFERVDKTLFLLIVLTPFGVGMFFWLKPKYLAIQEKLRERLS